MGTTESIPIQPNHRSVNNDRTDNNGSEVTDTNYSDTIIGSNPTKATNAVLPRPEGRGITTTAPSNHSAHPQAARRSDDPNQHGDVAASLKAAKMGNIVDKKRDSPTGCRLVRKPAKRTAAILDILKDVEDYEMIVDVSSNNEKAKKSSSKGKRPKDSKNGSYMSSSKKRKAERDSTSSSSSSANKDRGSEKKPKLAKALSDKSGKNSSAKKSQSMEDSETSSKHGKTKKPKNSNKLSSKLKDKDPVLRHVLFSSETSECSNKEAKTKSNYQYHEEAGRWKAQQETMQKYNEQLKSVEAAANTDGPPRTLDQDSDRVKFPHIHDILMGRGNGVAQFPGNQVFRNFCWNAREAYHKAVRNEKGKVAEAVIQLVKNRNPPGRFLERQNDGCYTEVPHDRVKEKICQALREKKWAPCGKDGGDESYYFEDSFEKDEPSSPEPYVKKKSNDNVSKDKHKVKVREQSLSSAASSDGDPDIVKMASSQVPVIRVPRTSVKVSSNSTNGDSSEFLLELVGEGARVSVYWPLDDTYYGATVVQRVHNFCYLRYDDFEIEWLDLSKHKFKLLHIMDSVNEPKMKKKSGAAFSKKSKKALNRE